MFIVKWILSPGQSELDSVWNSPSNLPQNSKTNLYLVHLHGLLHVVAVALVIVRLLPAVVVLVGLVGRRNLMVGLVLHIDGLVVTGVTSQTVSTSWVCVCDDGWLQRIHGGFYHRFICDRDDDGGSDGGGFSWLGGVVGVVLIFICVLETQRGKVKFRLQIPTELKT